MPQLPDGTEVGTSSRMRRRGGVSRGKVHWSLAGRWEKIQRRKKLQKNDSRWCKWWTEGSSTRTKELKRGKKAGREPRGINGSAKATKGSKETWKGEPHRINLEGKAQDQNHGALLEKKGIKRKR